MKARFTTHGRYGTPEYRSWIAAKNRCYNPRNSDWSDYGGRGITMCDEWRDDFAAFLRDMGPRPSGRSIDRIDHNGPYAPGNCRWATTDQQANNQRSNIGLNFGGKTHTLAEWARITGIPRGALEQRVSAGWTTERTLTTPLRGSG